MLSIVIPVVGDSQPFEQGLLSVLENRPAACEIIAVFNDHYVDPYSLGDEIRLLPAKRGFGLVQCLTAGIEQARGRFVHVLASGAEVSPAWAEAALERFDDPAVGSVVPLVLDPQQRQRIVSAGVAYQRRGRRIVRGEGFLHGELRQLNGQPLGPSMSAGFFRLEALQSVGGWAANLGSSWADIDLALRLQRTGCTSRFAPNSVVYSTAPHSRSSAVAEGLHAERTFCRHAAGVSRPLELGYHAGLWMAEALGGFVRPADWIRLAGRAAALLELPKHRRAHRTMERGLTTHSADQRQAPHREAA